MNALDIVILVLMGANLVLGYAYGFLRRALSFVGLFVGVGFATVASPRLAVTVMKSYDPSQVLWVNLGVYLACVLASLLLFEGMGAVYARLLQQYTSLLLDHFSGALAGVIVGATEVALLLVLSVNLLQANLPSGRPYPANFSQVQATFQDSALASRFYNLQPLAQLVFSPVLPGNPRAYFTQSA